MLEGFTRQFLKKVIKVLMALRFFFFIFNTVAMAMCTFRENEPLPLKD